MMEDIPKVLAELRGAGDDSLRDWFAGQALVGMLASMKEGSCAYGEIAEGCYFMADAMIEARETSR